MFFQALSIVIILLLGMLVFHATPSFSILLSSQLLAGAKVTDVDNHQRSVLHMAVEGDFPTILSILLENAADPDIMDEEGSNRESICM